MGLDIYRLQKEFPTLQRVVGCNRLVYLDNAATTHRPKTVIEAIKEYYEKYNANVFRSGHYLARESMKRYITAQQTFLSFINAEGEGVVVFTKNATEALNALSFGLTYKDIVEGNLKDKIVVTTYLEHNSNLVPWLRLQDFGVKVKLIPLTDDYDIDYDHLYRFLSEHHKNILICSITHASNVTGTVADIVKVGEMCKEFDIPFSVDSAQGLAHASVDVKEASIDFLAFSGHKIYAPFGIGGLYISNRMLDRLSGFIVGGGTVERVSETRAVYKPISEALIGGTPNVEGAVGLTSALRFFSELGKDAIFSHEKELVEHTFEYIERFSKDFSEKFKYVGPRNISRKIGVFSFYIKGYETTDPVGFLDEEGVAVRGGKHCAHLFHRYANIPYTLRASYALYNSKEDIDIFFDVLEAYLKMT